MKILNKYFGLATFAIASLAFTACSEDTADYSEGAANKDSYVYFDAEKNASLLSLGADAKDFTVTISRSDSADALTVPLLKKSDYMEAFDVPSEVSFAAGEGHKDITVKLTNDFKFLDSHKLYVTIPENYRLVDYADSTSKYNGVSMKVERQDYKLYLTGTFGSYFYSNDNNPVEFKRKLYRSASQPDHYRFYNLYENGYNVDFTMDSTNMVKMKTQETGVTYDSYGMVSISIGKKSYWDPNNSAFVFNWSFDVAAGSFGVMQEYFIVGEQ